MASCMPSSVISLEFMQCAHYSLGIKENVKEMYRTLELGVMCSRCITISRGRRLNLKFMGNQDTQASTSLKRLEKWFIISLFGQFVLNFTLNFGAFVVCFCQQNYISLVSHSPNVLISKYYYVIRRFNFCIYFYRWHLNLI